MYIETTRAMGAGEFVSFPYLTEVTGEPADYAPTQNFGVPYQPPISYPDVPRPEYQPPVSVPNESEPAMICMSENIVQTKNDDIALLQGEVRRLRSQLESLTPPEQSRTTYQQPLIEVGSETRQQPDNSLQASWSSLFGTTRAMSKYLR